VGERGRGSWAAWLCWAKREAGRPSSACPLFLFLNSLSPKSLNETFEAFIKLFRGWGKKKNCSHKIPYNFVLISKAKFQIEFEPQIKTSSRFLNKFILGIFV